MEKNQKFAIRCCTTIVVPFRVVEKNVLNNIKAKDHAYSILHQVALTIAIATTYVDELMDSFSNI